MALIYNHWTTLLGVLDDIPDSANPEYQYQTLASNRPKMPATDV